MTPATTERQAPAAAGERKRDAAVLELRGLSRRFGDVVALDDVSFSAAAGQVVGFVGTNGAGKTTAMRIVLGVLAADAGEVCWRGQPLDAATRRRFGYMPEERGLYPKMRVRDQLRYLAQLHGLDASAADASAGRWIDTVGLTERAGSRVEELSLGNQQRVQLAAALVHDPDVLILDEPFAGLDPVGTDVMSGVLHERAEAGVPVVFSSHQLELVERLCDAVAIIHSGRIVAAGAVADLRAGGARRYRVEVDGDRDWARRVPGVRAVGDGTVLELDQGVDDQRVLAAAREAGAVRHFSLLKPTLTELFREVVSPDAARAEVSS